MDYLAISAVSKITGIPTFTLRNWEKRYSWFPAGLRGPNNRRHYSHSDLEIIIKAKEMRDSGISLSSVANQKQLVKAPKRVNRDKLVAEAMMNRCLRTLEKFDVLEMEAAFSEMEKDFSPVQMVHLVIQPLIEELLEMGRHSEKNEFLGQFSCHFLKTKLIHYYNIRVQKRKMDLNNDYPTSIIAMPLGETNELPGLYVFSTLLYHSSTIVYLGANVSPSSLEHLAEHFDPKRLRAFLPVSKSSSLVYSASLEDHFDFPILFPLFFNFIGNPSSRYLMGDFKKENFSSQIRDFLKK